MGKPKKQHRKKRYNYDIDRKKVWKKQKKLPEIECKQIKHAWDTRKSLKQNMKDMGLSIDPNETLKIPQTKDTMTKIKSLPEEFTPTKLPEKTKKSKVVEELEAEANVEQASTMRLSEPEVRYCIYMMEKHGDDFKAMARDSRNYYQDTPKQIKRKINKFKSIPDQYNAYLRSKEAGETQLR